MIKVLVNIRVSLSFFFFFFFQNLTGAITYRIAQALYLGKGNIMSEAKNMNNQNVLVNIHIFSGADDTQVLE